MLKARIGSMMAKPADAGQHADPTGSALLMLVIILLLLLPFAGCADSRLTDADDLPEFVLEVSGDEFRVQVADPTEASALLQRLASGEIGVVSGELLPGDGGFNQPWSWHLDPLTVHVPDASIELCDGRPSMVEDDLSYWLGTVGRFCPWGARVVRRQY